MSLARLAVPAVLLVLSGAASAQEPPVYASNYDVVLRADGNSWRVNSRARVRDGHAIPVEFGPFKVEIGVAGRDERSVTIELRLFEKASGSWHRMAAKGLSFPAQLGIPVEFAWSGAGLELDLALVLSVLDP